MRQRGTKENVDSGGAHSGGAHSGSAQFEALDSLSIQYWSDVEKIADSVLKSNGNKGSVTRENLAREVENGTFKGSQAQVAGALYESFYQIKPQSMVSKLFGEQKLDESDISKAVSKIKNAQKRFQDSDAATYIRLGMQINQDMKEIANVQNDPHARELYADANPFDSVNVDNVTMGFAGDCAFKAALTAVVETHPETIVNMLHAKTANDLQVNFPGMPAKPVRIKPPSDEEIGLYSMQAKRGNWASALEKSYGEFVYQNSPNKKALQDKVGAEIAASNGYSEVALEALTGHKIAMLDVTQMSEGQLRSTLSAAQRDKLSVVLNTPPGDQAQNTQGGYSIDHAFAVLGIDARGEVTVRDPRANGPNRADGVSQVSLGTLKANFKVLWVETNKTL